MKRILVIITCLAVVAVSGCSKENSNQFHPYPDKEINDTNWYSVVPASAKVRQLDSIFALPSINDSVNVTTGETIAFGDSVTITFPPGFCSVPGANISKVNVAVTLLGTKGDMVRVDKPTMSYDKLLVTGGALQIKATYNGQPVQLAAGKMIHVSIISKMSNNTPSQNMRVFYGKEDAYPASATQNFTWVPADSSSTSFVSGFTDTTTGLRGYSFFAHRFGWVNCDYFSDSTQPRTKVNVSLPLNYTNANTNVFAVLHQPDIVAQLMANPATKTFSIPNIYVGKVVTFVTMSYIDGKLYLGSKMVTIAPNMNLHIVPEQKTKQQIESFLSNL